MTAIGQSITTSRRRDVDITSAATAAVAAETSDTPPYRSIYASSIFAVTMFFLLGIGIPASMAYGNATGWGIAAFSAFWGGPSFGVMSGGARVSTWHDKHGGEH